MNQTNNYAIVASGAVTNIVVWDGASEWTPPEGAKAVLIPEGQAVDIGYTYDGMVFSAPAVVTR